MRKTSSRKKVAMMLVPAATAGGFIGLTAQAAHAESGSQSVSYYDVNGNYVQCRIVSDLEYGLLGPNTLEADSEAFPENDSDTDCLISNVEVAATYTEKSDGVQVTNTSVGMGGSVFGYWANVKNVHVSTVNTFVFRNCDNSQSVCTYTFNLSHGK